MKSGPCATQLYIRSDTASQGGGPNYQDEAVKIKKLINKKTDMSLKKMIQIKKLWLNKEGVVELKMERIMNKNKTLWMALGSPLRLENRIMITKRYHQWGAADVKLSYLVSILRHPTKRQNYSGTLH